MGTERFFKPGSHYRIDDRSGFAIRAERTRKEWTGHIVREESWEPRNQQDFVRGVRDYQNVELFRTRQNDTSIDVSTALSVKAATLATVLTVDSTTNFSNGDTVSVMLDNGVQHVTTLNGAPAASTITLLKGLPSAASVGNMVFDRSATSQQPTQSSFPKGG